MHLPHIIKQIAKTDTIGLIAKLILVGFHGISQHTVFNPIQVGRHTHNLVIMLELSATVMLSLHHIFRAMSNGFSTIDPWAHSRGRHYIPNRRGLGFVSEFGKIVLILLWDATIKARLYIWRVSYDNIL